MASTILLFVLNKLMLMGGEARLKVVDDIITNVLDLMPTECQKHWMRLDTYLTFIYDLARSHVQILHILVGKKVVTRLMDLMAKYNPQSLVYSQVNPPLESLVKTVSFIVRAVPCLVDPAEIERREGMDFTSAYSAAMSDRGQSKFHVPLQQSFALETLSEEEARLLLPEDCLRALFLHNKSFKVFYANTSRHGFESEAAAKMIAHLCYRNREFSRKMAKHILKGTNRSSADELGPFLEVMKQFLAVDDELSNLRMEWVFGVADFVLKSAGYQTYNQLPKAGVANADGISA